jgi:hypothetical protein
MNRFILAAPNKGFCPNGAAGVLIYRPIRLPGAV